MKKILTALFCAFILFSFSALADEETVITLNGTSIECSNTEAVSIDGSTATITVPGEYTITGTLDNGQIIVDTQQEGKTSLTLKDAVINCDGSAPLYIKNSESRVTVHMAEETVNKLTGGAASKPEKGSGLPSGVLYSVSNLTITGAGQLCIKANAVDGIVSKNDLRIKDGTIIVSAPLTGIRAKDSVEISGGTVTVEAGKDGIKATSTKDSDHGFISITGGLVSVECGDDAFSYTTRLSVTDGMVITSVKAEE